MILRPLRLAAILVPLSVAGLLAPGSARAARPATVDVDDVEMRDGVGPSSKVIVKLPKGAPLAVSNQPIEGFYKARTAQGVVGFVRADALVLSEPVQPPPQPEAPSAADAPAPAAPRKASARAPGAAAFNRFRVKALGGYDLFSVSDINTLFRADALQNGYRYGFELEYFLSPGVAIAGRFEKVFKSVLGRDQTTLHTFELDLSSYPCTLGLDVRLLESGRLAVHGGLLGGLALKTGLTAQDLNSAEPNLTVLSGGGLAGVARVDASFSFSSTWSVFGEAGYRYLKTPQMVPPESVNGSELFKDASTGEFIPVAFDLSGPFVSVGLGVSF